MRLITDENISWRIKKLMPHWEILPSNEIKSVQKLSDLFIWRFAKANNFNILTFDEDFSDLQNLYSYPPKIIWLRTGNIKTTEIVSTLLKFEEDINLFLANDDAGIYEIYL